MRRRLLAFSGSRAELGLQRPILEACRQHRGFESVDVVLGGVHNLDQFGSTENEAIDFGLEPIKVLRAPPSLGSLSSTATAIGETIKQVVGVIQEYEPDLFLVYADRYETFAASVAATQSGVVTVHVEGGDVTQGGALDDSLRDAITRISHYHLATSDASAKRIAAMGEQEQRIFVIGNVALDAAREVTDDEVRSALASLNFSSDVGVVLATLHPIPLDPRESAAAQVSFAAGVRKALQLGLQVVVTYPNGDPGFQQVLQTIQDLENDSHPNLRIVESLGSKRYRNLLSASRFTPVLVFGNSSSGIKEAPVFGCISINMGTRQAGRWKAESVLDVPSDPRDVVAAIEGWVSDSKLGLIYTHVPINGSGSAGEKAAEILASLQLGTAALLKPAWHARSLEL